jgi:hypothetical protein
MQQAVSLTLSYSRAVNEGLVGCLLCIVTLATPLSRHHGTGSVPSQVKAASGTRVDSNIYAVGDVDLWLIGPEIGDLIKDLTNQAMELAGFRPANEAAHEKRQTTTNGIESR